MTVSVRIVNSDQSKVADWMLDGEEPKLQEGQLISLSTTLFKVTATSFSRVILLSTAKARLSIRFEHVMDGPLIELSITGLRLGDVRELHDKITEMAYGYEPLVIKTAPIEPPKLEDPSAWRMIRGFVGGISNDIRRADTYWQSVCRRSFLLFHQCRRHIFGR